MKNSHSSVVILGELEEPIRAELFSVERLEQHAESLAAAQHVTPDPRKGRPLAGRVRENGRVLLDCYRVIAEAIREERAITPAAEWLVDNFHIVDEQLREIREDLPLSYYRELPKLAGGHLEGYPRVYGIAWAFVAHSDSRFDPEALRRFVRAYQRVQPLSIGELWAIAINLRVMLVENLRRLAEGIVERRAARQEADALADRLLGLIDKPAERADAVLRKYEGEALSMAFAVQLVQRLRDQDPDVIPALLWLDERLAESGTTADEIVRLEHQRQAAMNVTVRNIITSMREMSAFDWSEFFESVSLVDEILRDGSDFAAMNFATRDRYRHAIEDLARGSKLSELEIARRAVERAQRARRDTGQVPDARREDPGYYLISKGRVSFEKETGFRVSWRHRLIRAYVGMATPAYLGTIAILTGLILTLPLLTGIEPWSSRSGLLLFAFLALIPASDLAIALVNRFLLELFAPRPLPKLELRDGVPPGLRTMVVVPTIFTSEAQARELIERLEVHYLANPQGDLRFALLSDWADAHNETMPGDEELLAAAIEGIEQLNLHHGPAPEGGERFLLFHRKRVWNAREGKWIGWERKRGKLHELNRLLRGATDTTFLPVGDRPAEAPSGVRYVITLDSDTKFPRETARRLVSTMAHPLNRPRFDARRGRVVEGYGVMQPRVMPALPGDREESVFHLIFAGPCGVDPYAAAVSDIYQDLFGEGSYTGKGIYDVDAFETALTGRVPENALLSHDLFEGLFARAGLVTDIELFEDFPSHYQLAALRQHRWARGDWQLLPWIFGRTSRSISWIGRWKMLDNLRRSLFAPAALLILIAGWTLPFASSAVWTHFIVGTIAFPPLFHFVTGLLPQRLGISKRTHLRTLMTDLTIAASQVALTVAFLAHQAWLMADAILRTLARLFWTRRRLLEWVTAARAKAGLSLDLAAFYRHMAAAVAISGGVATVVALNKLDAWQEAAPMLLLWAFSPAVARWVSLPPRLIGPEPLSDADARVLRLTSRQTWRFFEVFAGSEDHGLPPDNLQEDPRPVVAHRTSPTNIGLYLLSISAARDFGWVGTAECVDRLDATLATMGTLERFRGHFYNWYETRDLRPLEPKYVSTVDSGNLAGHLITLQNACREMMDQPLLGRRALSGIEDALLLVRQAESAIKDHPRTQTVTRKDLDDALEGLHELLGALPATPSDWAERFAQLETRANTLVDIARTLTEERGESGNLEVLNWAEAARACIASHGRDLDLMFPWAKLLREGASPELPAEVRQMLASVTTPAETPDHCVAALRELEVFREQVGNMNPVGARVIPYLDELARGLENSAAASKVLAHRLAAHARLCGEMADAMEFDFLFDEERKLFSIGFRVSDGRLDSGHYDLLASEARLSSFIAIAKGDVPSSHWFQLSRPLTPVGKGSALISWSGSMFEYLMPLLIMRSHTRSMLDQTYRLVVRRQIKYGAERGVPWGVSESAFSARDLALTYQYSNFGVPGLGLKRGLSEDIVIAPYATALAAMVDPAAAVRNFTRLAEEGAAGRYGFYEALDYTASRLPEGKKVVVVRAYMAHHQGMSIVAIANVLRDGVMRERFHAEPMIQATELLLQETTPRGVAVARPRAEEVKAAVDVRDLVPPVLRRFRSPHDLIPRTHLLTNGQYVVMMTAAGSGYSRWRDLAITRWREDVTRDCWGSYVFLRDAESGEVWSAGYHPSGAEPDHYEVVFSEDRAEIHRRDGALSTTLEVLVSPEDDAEVRRVSIRNFGSRPRIVELTSYAEVVMAPPAGDAAHPAFSNLFVQTEFVPDLAALLATRRPRSPSETRVWAGHVVIVEGETLAGVQYETDRARFLGRGREIRNPVSVIDGRPLSNTAGSVLDPILSLRRRVRIAPGSTARVVFSTFIAPSREVALDLADKYRDLATFERAATLAWTQAQVQLRHLRIGTDEAHLFQRIANRILYSDPSLRPSSEVLRRNERGPSALWQHGISGDLPIVLVHIDESGDREIVRQLLHAHEYWRMKRLAVDLVILNEQPTSYAQELQAALETLKRASQSASRHEEHEPHGKVFILRADLLPAADRDLLRTVARAVLLGRQGSLAEQVVRLIRAPNTPLPPPRVAAARPLAEVPPPRPELEFFNGLGGFASGGREYVTILGEGQWTPAPWINVIANESFGFQVSELGSGYTWSQNSRENQITPWSNDPVTDPPGEAIYIKDEETGEIWGPTALPIREDAWPYVARHGQGYSRFEHVSHGIALELLQFVPLQDPIKISRLVVENRTPRPRRLSVTAYVEWVLGVSRPASAPLIVTEIDQDTGAMFARNAWNSEFGERVAFADLGGRQTSWTSDRTEFLGRNGTLDYPAALVRREPLSQKTGAGFDPCGVLQTMLELRPNARIEILFLLGQAATSQEAQQLIVRYRDRAVETSLRPVIDRWDDILGGLNVKTPDRSLDIMLNRWLLYQTLACRVWARSAFYQASGAYGFRDQLQDVIALTVATRQITREHLLRAAARQFVEGDVQHWWHPPSGRGVRTRISDDLLWLPYAVAHYIEVTGDKAILDEFVSFLEGAPLAADQHELYFEPRTAEMPGTLFEHCARALDRSLSVGSHGLPLMGSGDWNDGMNRVGHQGKGESVWLGWFLYATLQKFIPLAEAARESRRAESWRRHVASLKQALERAWDGDWYRRAYFDDGTPLGSATNSECRIDSIAQSWGIISGAADRARGARAMAAVEEYLVRRGDGLVLLFTPPFDRIPLDPGYIKGYLPGVRENGGQYTHAAIWSTVAFAMLGDGDKAGELFTVLNPINHASTRAGVHRYKVEPYVVAGDIYAEPPHVGRGGWTWYTGSAGWMYQAGIQWILGFRLKGARLLIDPCIPRAWRDFEIRFAYHSARYEILVENPRGATRGVSSIEIDGKTLASGVNEIELADDRATHQVRVILG